MKINYKNKILGMSAAAAMLLGSSVYAGKIVTDTDLGWEPYKQYGFGGWNLGNVNVMITDLEFNELNNKQFNSDGTYDPMVIGETFESEIFDIDTNSTVMGRLHGKNWPVGEPSGIKIINGDLNTNNGKPENCIMTTSYLDATDTGTGESGYLDTTANAGPVPTTCSSPFQTHKRFKVNMQPTTVIDYNTTTGYGKPVEFVFNLDPADQSIQRYQVFQKINNYTGMRLDGYKIEVLDGNGNPNDALTLSIGLGENDTKDPVEDIWDPEDMANFSHGLWGPKDQHFPTNGFFDAVRAGFDVNETGHGTDTLVGGPGTLGSNYTALFGIWLPSKWQPIGIFHDDDNDPTTDAELVAFWGTRPDAPIGTSPAWHKGQADGWAEPTPVDLITWYTDPLYSVGNIEDTLNLGLNYIVNVGDNTQIATPTFIVRITPRVAAVQTPPKYIMDDNVTYIMPSTDYNGTDTHLVISPAPYFNLDTNLSVGVADTNVTNADPATIDKVIVVLTASNGDEENLTLTETDVNSSIFVATIETDTNAAASDNIINVVDGTIVTATYKGLTAETTATDGIVTPPVTDPDLVPSSGGGGCTYNPDSKHFDMMFLMMMALGLLYPLRRRFIK